VQLRGIDTLGFDHVYVINLPKRIDRREKIFTELSYLGLEHTYCINPVDGNNIDISDLIKLKKINPYFIDPVGIVTTGMYGCAFSHYNVWTEFLESGYDTALILEDDVYLGTPKDEVFMRLWKLISEELVTLDWDIFFLARLSVNLFGDKVTENIIKPHSSWEIKKHGVWGAHAYVITRKAAERMVKDYLPVKYAVDVFIDSYTSDKELNVYSVNTSYWYQYSAFLRMERSRAIKEATQQYRDIDSDINDYVKGNVLSQNHINKNYVKVQIYYNNRTYNFLTKESYKEFINEDKLKEVL